MPSYKKAVGLLGDLLDDFADVGNKKQIRAQSEEGQKHLNRMLGKTDLADLPAGAEDYNRNIFYHVGNPDMSAYDITAERVANKQAPVGMYTYPSKRKSDTYLRDHSRWSDAPVAQHPIVTSGENVFVIGADKPTEGMRQSFIKAMEEASPRMESYADMPSHRKAYYDEKINNFMRWGDPTGLPITDQAMRKIYTDNGFDMILRNSDEFVHLKPEQLRRTDAEFNPMYKGENGLKLGVGGLGATVFGKMLADEEERKRGLLDGL